MLSKVQEFLLLNRDSHASDQLRLSRSSALRIICLCGLLLVLGVAMHSSYHALVAGRYSVPLITLFFYSLLLVQAWLAPRYYQLMAWLMLGTIVGGGLCMQLFIHDPDLAKLGSLFLYSLPLVALLLLGLRVAIGCMVFNLIPFGFLLYDHPLPALFGIDITLPNSHQYLHWLIFIFFNICFPLAVARVMKTFAASLAHRQTLLNDMARNNSFYRMIFESGEQGRLVIDKQGHIEASNRRARRLLGDDRPEGKSLAAWLPAHLLSSLQQVGVWPCKLSEDKLWHVTSTGLSGGQHQLLLIDDHTENRRLRQRLQKVEQHTQQLKWFDELTGLPNLSSFLSRLRQVFAEQKAPGLLAMIKVHTRLHEQHPYSANWLAKQLQPQWSNQDFFCAWDPDTLLLALYDGVNVTAEQLLEQAVAGLMAVAPAAGLKCGVLLRPEAAAPELLLRHVRYALEQLHGRVGIQIFDAGQYMQDKDDASLLEDLKMALVNKQISAAYQPQYCTERQCVTGMEALARWNHPKLGFVSPAHFCRLAEQHGLSIALTEAMLARVSRDRKQWLAQGIVPPRISVNFSTHELADDGLVRHWLTLCKQYGLSSETLEIELTESAFTEDESSLYKRLALLRKMGISVAVDDFGTGYSSLGRVVSMPVSKIKIDRSLIRDITSNERKRKLIRTIQVLSQTLDAQLLIEGVEEPEQLAILEQLGCRLYQGYLFSRPLNPGQVVDYLRDLTPLAAETAAIG